MNSENKIYQVPEFTGEHIPVKEAARIMGKDIEYVRIGIIEGFLPMGTVNHGVKMYKNHAQKMYNQPSIN